MGKEASYSAVPWFWSDQYEHKLQMVGYSADGNSQVLRGNKDKQHFSIFYLKDDHLVAVDSAREFMVGRKFYGKKFDPIKLADEAIEVQDAVI